MIFVLSLRCCCCYCDWGISEPLNYMMFAALFSFCDYFVLFECPLVVKKY